MPEEKKNAKKPAAKKPASTRKKSAEPTPKAAKKPKDMAKVPVTTSDEATARLSAELDKVRREDGISHSGKKSIAEATAFRVRNRRTIFACVEIGFLLLAAFFFQFCVAGYSFSALICLGIAVLIAFYTFVPKVFKNSRTVIRIVTILLCLILIVAGITEALIIKASFGSPETECEYLLVLGAKVRADGPSMSLLDRINRAYDYLTAHPDTIAVVSGGKGGDEPLTEAQCMYDSLVALGISPSRIWIEDKATSTWENLQYSLALIEEKTGQRPTELAVLSSEYHLFRASLFTRAAGAEFIGIPAETSNFFLKINYYLREVAGVWHYILLGGQYHA